MTMSANTKTWIPFAIALAAAAGLILYGAFAAQNEHFRTRPTEVGSLFTTLGTIAVYVAAAGFSWLWFKKKFRSPSMLVRRVCKLLHALHRALGWSTLALGAAHGAYWLVNRPLDDNSYTGLASFAILLVVAGYGLFVPKIRNKWMRLAHRTLGIAWAPVLFLHAGGSAIAAVGIVIGVGVLVRMLESIASRPATTRE